MAQGPSGSVFLERRSYRRRRLVDTLKLMLLLGGWLFLLPVLWPNGGDPSVETPAMSSVLIFVFVVWTALVVLSAALVIGLRLFPDRARESETS